MVFHKQHHGPEFGGQHFAERLLGKAADPGGAQRADSEGVDPDVFKEQAGLRFGQAIFLAQAFQAGFGGGIQLAEHIVEPDGGAVFLHKKKLVELRLPHAEEHHLHPYLLEERQVGVALFGKAFKAAHGSGAHLLLHLLHAGKHREDRAGRAAQGISQLLGGQRLRSPLGNKRRGLKGAKKSRARALRGKFGRFLILRSRDPGRFFGAAPR